MTLLFPARIDNEFRGHRLGLWLFALVMLAKTAIAFGTIFNGRAAAEAADGIPLDSFGAAGAHAFLTVFAMWGLAQLVPGALATIALLRYRAMIPLLYLVFLLEHIARRVLLFTHPLAASVAPGWHINVGLVALMVIGLIVSLRPR
jgi:hypothetical protein